MTGIRRNVPLALITMVAMDAIVIEPSIYKTHFTSIFVWTPHPPHQTFLRQLSV